MRRRVRRVISPVRAAASFLVCSLHIGVGPIAEAPLPHSLGVEVVWGAERGAESLREELDQELLSGLRRARCFRTVCPGTCPDEGRPRLRVRWVVDRLEEITEHDSTLAQHHSPMESPNVDQGIVARIRLDGRWVIEALVPEPVVLRERTVRLQPTHRPLGLEDGRYEARRSLMAAAVQTTVAAVCGDSERKWARRIEQAKARQTAPKAR